ncbi:MAG: TolC family protein [Planctomycetota bacterium]|nr:TolC family protein [Planctomycetota bacterium]
MRPASPGILILLAACLFTGGCKTNQSADVASYQAISDPGGAQAQQEADAELSLEQAMRLTATYNEQLAQRGENYIQALASRQRAASALKPTLDLFANASLKENTGSAGIFQTDGGLSGQYRLLTGKSDLRTVDAADARIEAARWLILDLRESLLVQVARAYYEALRAQRLTQTLESSVKAQSDRLADARARNEVGLARPLDVSQIEAQVARTSSLLIAAQRQAAESRSTLKLLTNAQIDASPLSDGFEPPQLTLDQSQLIQLAQAHRQDLLAAAAQIDASRSLVDAAIGQYSPALSLNLDYFLFRSPQDSAPNLTSILGVRMPLFAAGRIEAQVREAWSVFRQQVLVHRATQREIRRDVETAFLRLEASQRLVAQLEIQVSAAAQSVELAEASYAAGLGTNLERVVAQDQLLAAQLEAISAAFTTKIAYLELLRACGTLSHEMIATPLPTPGDTPPPVTDVPLLDRSATPPSATTPATETQR